MKNLIFLLSVMFLLFGTFAKGQDLNNKPEVIAGNTITKGTKVIGGGIGNSAQINKDYTSTNFGINAEYGKFITNRFLLSGEINSGIYHESMRPTSNFNSYTLGVGASFDYFFIVKNRSAFSIGGSLSVLRLNSFFDKEQESNRTLLNRSLGLQYYYFITSYFVADCGLYYTKSSDFIMSYAQNANNSNTYNRGNISFGTGFSWFIPNSKPQNIDNKPYASNTIVKGTKVIGGNIGGLIDFSKDNGSYNFDLSSHYAQFITNRLLISGGINLGTGRAWGTQGKSTNNGYGINAGVGYYFWVKNRTAWALSAGFDFGKDNIVNELNIEHYYGTSIDGGASLSYFYFLTPFFALDASLNYKRNYEFGSEFFNNMTNLSNSQQGELTTSIGMSWFLTKACR